MYNTNTHTHSTTWPNFASFTLSLASSSFHSFTYLCFGGVGGSADGKNRSTQTVVDANDDGHDDHDHGKREREVGYIIKRSS